MVKDAKPRKVVEPPVATIRDFREFAGITLDDLARRITAVGYPITKAGLGNIETGVRGPSHEFLDAWRDAMNELAGSLGTGRVERAPRVLDRPARAAATNRAAA